MSSITFKNWEGEYVKDPDGIRGSLEITQEDAVKYGTAWNEYVQEIKAKNCLTLADFTDPADFIFDKFLKDHEDELPVPEVGGGYSYTSLSLLSDLTFKRRLFGAIRGKKPLTAHFVLRNDGHNCWVSYWNVVIDK